MNYIVFDLEWNQASRKSSEVKGLPFEIIEIGAIKLNEKFEKIGEYSRLIRPSVYHHLHGITQDIVHISMNDLKHEQTFAPVCRHFLKWCGDDPLYCTWGTLDLSELQRNMSYFGFPDLSDGPIPFLDVQKLYALTFEPEDDKKRRALNYSVEQLGLLDDIPFHRAFGDAYYTAKVLREISKRPGSNKILNRLSYDLYHIPKDKLSEIHVDFGTYTKYISREFANKYAATKDPDVMDTHCHKCGRATKARIDWFTPNGKHYFYVGACWRHGLVKNKVRVFKTEGDAVFVVKTTKTINRKQLAEIRERQNKLRESRRERRKGRNKKDAE